MRPRSRSVNPAQHFTEPPPRYSEASLVKQLEELGIGRPSTYASIISTLRDRAYVKMDRQRFMPEDKGRLVTTFLNSFFKRYVDYDFTADLEEKLDEVSDGKLDWKQLLRDFWKEFSATVGETKDLRISHVIDELEKVLAPHIFPHGETGVDPRKCPSCEDGRLNLKLGRFGAFVGCTNYPECKFTKPDRRQAGRRRCRPGGDRRCIPGTDEKITLRTGRFGPYVQLRRRRQAQAQRHCPRAPTSPKWTWRWRSSCCRCRAKSACIRKTARRSPPISAASGLTSPMTASMPRWIRPKTCSRSASTTPSP